MKLFGHHDPTPSELGARWARDRRVIATWLQRETGGHFDGAELRADGSSYIRFASEAGDISVHDYWSFARPDFSGSDRARSYADILARQEPILTLGYTRPGAQTPAELIVFLGGELLLDSGAAAAFAPLAAGVAPGALIALESAQAPGETRSIGLYDDPFLIAVLTAIWHQSQQPPKLV